MRWTGLIEHYRQYLPVSSKTPVITLYEGNTPLIPAEFLNKITGLQVFLKYEGLNPTGSFKDRGMTMAISKALEKGTKTVMCASTGNTSASAAAYAARAGIKCVVLIPNGNIALGKLAQAMIHQAQVIAIDGNFDDALNLVKEITSQYPVELVNSLNPFRIEGQKTAAFEICDFLGDAPEFHAIPVGNAGNITAYWKGYKEYQGVGKSRTLPCMLGFQASGAAPIVHNRIIENPETIATAIRIGNPASWKSAIEARDQSQGLIDMVTDDEILDAYHQLAALSGVFVEPASAASVAGVIKKSKSGYFKGHQGERLVCTVTGHGLKDPKTAMKDLPEPKVVGADKKRNIEIDWSMMKYVILVPDGLADEPLKELGGRTPMEAARTPHMDFMAQNGFSALTQTIPDGMSPGSDIGNLALMGYDPKKNFSGRASLEAANLGIKLKDDEIVFRCNLVTVKDKKMFDYSAGHISTDEAKNLIEYLERSLSWPDLRFYPGKSYRHLMVIKTINVPAMLKVKTTPPHDMINKAVKTYLPSGIQSDVLLKIMNMSQKILEDHQINRMREDAGENPGNMIWLWGQGARPDLPSFKEQNGLKGSVISAVDLVNGIGRLAGLDVIDVPGANGYYDTNYKGKAQYALESLKKNDFVYVHVEATDEAGHNGDWKAKVDCCERFDKDVVGTILRSFKKPEGVRVLVCPDHPTPVAKRVHDRAPVPFVMWGDGINPNGTKSYSEKSASKIGLKFKSGKDMVRFFLKP